MTDDALLARLDALEARNAALEAEMSALRRAVASPPDPSPPAPLGRRQLLGKGLAAAGAAAAGAVLLDGAPAAAANGQPLLMGSGTNAATATTTLSITGDGHGVVLLDSGTQYPHVFNDATLAVRATDQRYSTAIAAISSSIGVEINADRGITVASQGRGINIISDSDGMEIQSDERAIGAVTSGGDEAIYAANNADGGVGVLASVINGGAIGVDAKATNGTGVRATATTSGIGVDAKVGTGTGVKATTNSGSGAYVSSNSGFGVEAYAFNGTALKARGTDFGVVAESLSTDPEEAAVAASSAKGMAIFVDSDSGDLLRGASSTGGGVAVSAPKFHLRLTNNENRGAPTGDTTITHVRGDIVETTSGDLWLCTTAGKPGTWRKLAGPATAGAFHVLPAPARVYDSRPGFAPTVGPKTPFAANTTRVFDLKVNASGVPAGATAVMVNLLLVNAAVGNGNATIWANGATKPVANTLVWGGDARRFSALAVTAIDTAARVQVNTSLATDLVIDVVGYYR